MLVRTGFESLCGQISVAMPVVHLAMLGICHAATDMSAIGWVMIAKQFKLSYKPKVVGLICGGRQYNKRNFTLLLIMKVTEIEFPNSKT